MEDILDREEAKPGTVQKRRIKAYILGCKLKYYGMNHEYSQLAKAFIDIGSSMIRDDEVISILANSSSFSLVS
jgi:hypothetical protein